MKLASCTLYNTTLHCWHTPSPFCRPTCYTEPRMYAEPHWRNRTFERYYTCSCSKLRHKAHQKVQKYSHTLPLKNGIVSCTFYESFTNKYGKVGKLRRVVSTPSGT